MEKESEKILNGNAELRTVYLIRKFDKNVARYIGVATACQHALEKNPDDETLVEDLGMAKNNFYTALDAFIQEYPALPAIIAGRLPALEKLRGQNWSSQENILKLKTVMLNIFNPFQAESSANKPS